MPSSIQDYTKDGLVIFCGAGISMVEPTCLPSWWELNEHVVLALSHQIELFCGVEQAADLARQINERRDNQRFPPEFQAEIISKHYGSDYFKVLQCLDGKEPNAVHLAIATLAKSGYVRAIVTSNFDRLLEIAFSKLGIPLKVYFHPEHFDNLAKQYQQSLSLDSTCQLLKLHGSVDDYHTLVDTLAQRMRGLSPSICDCLRHLLRNHHWLFMGYSGADLEANPQYLCLQTEAQHAVGFSWLARESTKTEPIEAVAKICSLYGERAHIVRGELPNWFLEEFCPLIPNDLPVPSPMSKEEMARRKQQASQAIVDHTREWSRLLGGVRAAEIIADILHQSVSNPQAARDLLTQALETQIHDDNAYAVLGNSLANMLNKAGPLSEAKTLAEKVLAKTNSGNQENRSGALTTLGLIEFNRGEYRQALNCFEQAYEIGAPLNNENLKSVILHNQAMALTKLSQIDRAKLIYEEELEITRDLGDVLAQAQVLNNIGDLLRQQDRYGEAIDVLKEAIQLRERLGDDRGVAHCLGNIATVYHHHGEFTKAVSAFKRVEAIFRGVGDQSGVATTLFSLGSILKEQNSYAEAESVCHQGLTIATQCEMQSERASGLWRMGSIYSFTNRYADARRLLDEALSIYEINGDQSGKADVLNEIGILLWRAQELDGAASKFKQAIAIRETLNQQSGRCEPLGNLALVLKDKGDLEQALVLLTEKLSIAQKLQTRSLMANAYYNIGTIQHQQKAIDKAIDSFNSAQQICQEVGLIDKAVDILSIMGEICGREGQIGSSLKWFDQSVQLAATVEQRTTTGQRLSNILMLLLENGYPQIAEQFVLRLRAIGAQVEIKPDNPNS
jgi:tetratricopeptide (TPR) repeat protein